MPEPLRSPKQSRVAAKNRAHPYPRPPNGHRTRDVGLTRSNSLMDTLKSIVTAPLSWLSLGDPQEPNESPQKRRVSGSERGGTPPRAKRVRRESPELEVEVAGYLDPPDTLFRTTRPPIPLWEGMNGLKPARTMTIDQPPPSPVEVTLPLSRGHSMISRTSMSVEPHAPPIRRSVTRELSMPPPSPFGRSYSRSSLTPQPSGATFGPSPKRKQRESTAPPLLPSPAPAPTFTRPQPSSAGKPGLFPRTHSRDLSEGPISVLLGRNRESMSPVRENPSRNLLVRDDVIETRLPSNVNAERTLSTLESYRTPLHLSRFPSTPPTSEHRPRKVHVPIPSKMRFDHTPEGRKQKSKRGPTIVGPYSSGMSGMRKLLAKRREEAAQDADAETRSPEQSHDPEVDKDGDDVLKDQANESDATAEEPMLRKAASQVNGVAAKADVQLPRTRSPPRSKPDGPYSSLRAPSNRVSRTHAPAPRMKTVRNKFSLDDDDDVEWSMSVEDVKNYQAQSAQGQPPILFSPTRKMSETGMQTDTGNVSVSRAKTPPLPAQSQTFDSLLSRIGPPTSIPGKEASAFPDAPASQPKPDHQDIFQPKENGETSSAPATLPFSLSAATSATKSVDVGASPFMSNVTTPAPSTSPAPATTSGTGAVPSFFANTKAQFTPPKVPSGSLFGGILPDTEKKDATEGPKNIFGGLGDAGKEDKSGQKEAKPSPFGVASKPSAFGVPTTSAFGGESSKAANSAQNNTASPFGGFGNATGSGVGEGPKATFQFGTPTGDGPASSDPAVSIFGTANKPDGGFSSPAAGASSKRAFSFPAAAPQSSTASAEKTDTNAETLGANTSSKRIVSFDAPSTTAAPVEAPKALFSFGAPALIQPANAAPEAPKSPFSFGAAPSTPPPADKKPSFSFGSTSNGGTQGFSFGSNALSTGAANGTAADTRATFIGFGNTGPSASQKTAESAPTESGDGMEVNGGDRMEESPTRTVDKKDMPATHLTQATSFSGFGSSGGGSGGGFSFGQEKPASSTSGFSFGDSKPSTGSGFSFGQSADKSTMGANPSTGFTFGGGVNKPTPAPTTTGFTFGSDAPKPGVQPQLSFGTPVNNPFNSGSTTNATASPGFGFGQSNANANPFGQSENGSSSAPSSPSLFAQQTPQPTQPQSPSFSFNTTPSNFSTPNTGTAQTSTAATQPFQFGASNSTDQQQAGTSGGNTMFTLGAAATPPPRKVKGLPSRRARRP